MKIKKSENGHAHLLLFAAVGFALVGFVGFNVYQKNNSVLQNATSLAANGTGGASAETNKKSKPAKSSKKAIVKKDVAVRILPPTLNDKKSAIGYLEVSVPGVSLKSRECSTAKVAFSAKRGDTIVKKDNERLRYVSEKRSGSGKGYCAYRLQLDDRKRSAVGTWEVSARLASGKYLNSFVPATQTGTITVAKHNVEISAVKRASNDPNNKNAFGYVEVKAPGVDLRRHHCSGVVRGVNLYNASNPDKMLYGKNGKNLRLRYVKDSRYNDGQGYCVLVLPKTSKKNPVTDPVVKLSFDGTDYLNVYPLGASRDSNNVSVQFRN